MESLLGNETPDHALPSTQRALAVSIRDAQRPWHGGNDAITAHNGFAVRGLHGRLRSPGNMPTLLAGAPGGLLTTWITFAPCFLWIFLGTPSIERVRKHKALSGALAAISAVVVGVVGIVLNLALWFTIRTLSRETVAISAMDSRSTRLWLAVSIYGFSYYLLERSFPSCNFGWEAHDLAGSCLAGIAFFLLD